MCHNDFPLLVLIDFCSLRSPLVILLLDFSRILVEVLLEDFLRVSNLVLTPGALLADYTQLIVHLFIRNEPSFHDPRLLWVGWNLNSPSTYAFFPGLPRHSLQASLYSFLFLFRLEFRLQYLGLMSTSNLLLLEIVLMFFDSLDFGYVELN